MGKIEDDYMIAILTRGRIDTQIFLESLPDLIKQLITIVCHPGERDEHLMRWRGRVNDVIEYGKNCSNIGEARGWLMNYCNKRGIKYVIQFDDNVVIGCRATYSGKLSMNNRLLTIRNNYSVNTQIDLYVQLFCNMLDCLRNKDYAMVGISHRSGNNFKKSAIDENIRLFACYGISVDKYYAIEERFQDIQQKEDFYIELGFLTNGYKTVCINLFTFDKARGANQLGGCSIWRNLENINKCSEKIKNRFPEFVSIVERDSNNWGGIRETKRKEVVIKWKKAYESGMNKN